MSDTTLQDAKTGIAENASEVTSQVKHKASDLGRTTAAKIDENREPAATGFESAARVIHQNAESLPSGEKVSDLAHSAADIRCLSGHHTRDSGDRTLRSPSGQNRDPR
jgi:hypothetical protein